MTVYSLHPHPKARASLSVLQHYRIHGIRPRGVAAVLAQSSATGTNGEKRGDEQTLVFTVLFFFFKLISVALFEEVVLLLLLGCIVN